MADDIEKELTAMPGVSELVARWSTQRIAAEDKGSRIIGEVLLSILALLADEYNGFELFESVLGDANGRKESAKRSVRDMPGLRCRLGRLNVTKPYQNASTCLKQ